MLYDGNEIEPRFIDGRSVEEHLAVSQYEQNMKNNNDALIKILNL